MGKIKNGFILILMCLIFIIADKTKIQASQKLLYDSEKKLNQTVKVDVTGDGKKDTVKFKAKMKNKEWIDSFTISVNGKKAFVAPKSYDFLYRVTYLYQSSKNIFLFIESYGNNYDSELSAIYKYDRKNKCFVNVLTLESQVSETVGEKIGATHIGAKVSTGKGRIKVVYDGQLDVVGRVKWIKTYTYNGKRFVEDKAIVNVKGRKSYTPLFPKAKDVTVGTDLEWTDSFKLVPGKKVKICKICKYDNGSFIGYYILISQAGKKGWIWSGYIDIFKNIMLCG